mmetsp:Transcript_56687/g.159062  ORF Transcript_56687/g.159062 Transcript_56687/m.159062 type:complete len:294 (+) Transcript_56687:1067-1948(+)
MPELSVSRPALVSSIVEKSPPVSETAQANQRMKQMKHSRTTTTGLICPDKRFWAIWSSSAIPLTFVSSRSLNVISPSPSRSHQPPSELPSASMTSTTCTSASASAAVATTGPKRTPAPVSPWPPAPAPSSPSPAHKTMASAMLPSSAPVLTACASPAERSGFASPSSRSDSFSLSSAPGADVSVGRSAVGILPSSSSCGSDVLPIMSGFGVSLPEGDCLPEGDLLPLGVFLPEPQGDMGPHFTVSLRVSLRRLFFRRKPWSCKYAWTSVGSKSPSPSKSKRADPNQYAKKRMM